MGWSNTQNIRKEKCVDAILLFYKQDIKQKQIW